MRIPVERGCRLFCIEITSPEIRKLLKGFEVVAEYLGQKGTARSIPGTFQIHTIGLIPIAAPGQ